ncbi:zinc finger SWIM domain-containing protein 7 isoform X1 [Lissotriton helveticus]
METLLPAVAEELLKEVKKAFLETSQIPDELLLALKFVFGSSALYALDLVDQHSVTRVTSPSGRMVFQVLGSSGKLYTCYSSCHYCSCPSFAFSVLKRNDSLLVLLGQCACVVGIICGSAQTCKHVLAIYLSQALGACQERSASDQQMSRLLLAREDGA